MHTHIHDLYKVHARARLDLQREIEKELEEEDPDLAKARAIISEAEGHESD